MTRRRGSRMRPVLCPFIPNDECVAWRPGRRRDDGQCCRAARRRSWAEVQHVWCSYNCTGHHGPGRNPNVSRMTFTIGTTQFVVHDALEMMVCFAASYFPSLTPMTIVMSSSFAGAEMTTRFAPAVICLRASPAFVNRPVDSRTMSTPSDFQGSAAGSFSRIPSPSPSIVIVRRPKAIRAFIGAVHRVVLEQVGQRLRVGQVIHRHEVQVLETAFLRRPDDLAPDASKPVDANLDRHSEDPSQGGASPGRRARPNVM